MPELRQDLVSGDWIIMAPERAKRPSDFLPKKKARKPSPKSTCQFEHLEKSEAWPPIASVPDLKRWRAVIIPNKYPALRHGDDCAVPMREGPYTHLAGVGHHDLLVTRDHAKDLTRMSLAEGVEVFQLLQRRYQTLTTHPCVAYTSTFFNWGAGAGASVYHPHYQMLTLPIVPPDVQHSLNGSRRYYERHRRCVHCEMLAQERKYRKRIVEKNARAIATTPYVSREPFEIRIYPQRHLPYFERTALPDLKATVAVLQSCLRRISKYLHDPDLNFFIHTAPLKEKNRYRHYHWHIEVLPKITTLGGLELGTGIDINVIDPDRAAFILHGRK